jgi:hypothetical protein
VNRHEWQADHTGIAAGHRANQPPAQALDTIRAGLIHRLAGSDIGFDLGIGKLGDGYIAGNQIELELSISQSLISSRQSYDGQTSIHRMRTPG